MAGLDPVAVPSNALFAPVWGDRFTDISTHEYRIADLQSSKRAFWQICNAVIQHAELAIE
jgi:hypothetical protein